MRSFSFTNDVVGPLDETFVVLTADKLPKRQQSPRSSRLNARFPKLSSTDESNLSNLYTFQNQDYLHFKVKYNPISLLFFFWQKCLNVVGKKHRITPSPRGQEMSGRHRCQ